VTCSSRLSTIEPAKHVGLISCNRMLIWLVGGVGRLGYIDRQTLFIIDPVPVYWIKEWMSHNLVPSWHDAMT
jgi:hypothetical protein